MGIIREPKGMDLVVGPSTLTVSDREHISLVIEQYKRTGRKPQQFARKDVKSSDQRRSANPR